MSEAQDYVIWGSAGHAKVLVEAIALLGGKVCAFFDNRSVDAVIEGAPIFLGEDGFEEWLNLHGELNDVAGATAIGGPFGRDRLDIQDRFHRYGISTPAIVHPEAVVSPTSYVGSGSQVLAFANIAADSQVGRACIVNHNASVDHECNLGDGVHIAPGATLCGSVSVGDNVFIGAGAILLPRVSIGEDAIIGAGAVVTKNVPSGVTVVGNPAAPIKSGSRY